MLIGKPTLETFDSFQAALANDRPRKRRPVEVDPVQFARVIKAMEMGARFPLRSLREAIGTGAWDSIMLDAMHKRMIKGWDAAAQALHWRKIASTIRNVSDFRTINVIQTGDFTTLDEVPEGGDYQETEFTDDRATYTVKKYGNIFAVTYESMSNDDLGVFGKVMQRFGGAAARTVEKYLFTTLIDGNAAIYDGNNLFDSTNHGNDLGASKPLNHDNLEAAIELMLAQTDLDGNPLDLVPRYLIVHPDQKYDAMRIILSEHKPSDVATINVHQGELDLCVTSRITSGRWYLVADPSLIETLEIGFLGGRQEPELFEESELSDAAFDRDVKRYKARHIFGMVIPDYRGWVRANV